MCCTALRVRSAISDRSNSAKPASMVNIMRPISELVSTLAIREFVERHQPAAQVEAAPKSASKPGGKAGAGVSRVGRLDLQGIIGLGGRFVWIAWRLDRHLLDHDRVLDLILDRSGSPSCVSIGMVSRCAG